MTIDPLFTSDEVLTILGKLRRYAYVRDRQTEREPRTITITDDEAAQLLAMLGEANLDD